MSWRTHPLVRFLASLKLAVVVMGVSMVVMAAGTVVESRWNADLARLETLDTEFQYRHKHNPIHHIQSRVKTLPSIMKKLSDMAQALADVVRGFFAVGHVTTVGHIQQ